MDAVVLFLMGSDLNQHLTAFNSSSIHLHFFSLNGMTVVNGLKGSQGKISCREIPSPLWKQSLCLQCVPSRE